MLVHLRVKSPWSQLGIFLGLLGGALVLAGLASAVIMLAVGAPSTSAGTIDWNKPGLTGTMKLLQAISSVVIFFLPAIIFALIVFKERPFYFLGLKPAPKRQMYILAVVCMMASFPLVSILGEINQAIPLPKWMVNLEKDTAKQMVAFLKAENTMDIVINIMVMALLPAVCEEICFRGALQRIIIQISTNAWAGIIITAILFSALHMQFLGFLPRMYLGVVLGAVYWYSGSLWPGILAHFVYNAIQVVGVAYAPEYIEKNPSMPLYSSIVSAIAVCALLWAIRSHSTVTYRKVYEADELNRGDQFIA